MQRQSSIYTRKTHQQRLSDTFADRHHHNRNLSNISQTVIWTFFATVSIAFHWSYAPYHFWSFIFQRSTSAFDRYQKLDHIACVPSQKPTPPQRIPTRTKKEAPAEGAAGAEFAWCTCQYSSFRIGAADSESFFDLAPDFIADFCRHFSRYYLSMFFIAVFHSMITSTPFKKQHHQAPQASRNNLLKKPIFCMLVFI